MRLPIDDGLLFVHIPKTAGTSFRESLQVLFGMDRVFCDYGPDPMTSAVVSSYIYPHRRFPELGEFLASQATPVCFCGHFPVRKYSPLFYAKNIVMFLRDPVQRVVSQYEHCRRVDDIKQSLQEFCSMPGHMNLQSRNIGRIPVSLIGFIGLQEMYKESLQVMQDYYQFDMQEFFSNINRGKESSKYTLDNETLKLILDNNKEDALLYARVQNLFKQRYAIFSEGKPYTHGAITALTEKRVAGWAINNASNDPVQIKIMLNDQPVAMALANHYRHDLREWNPGRQGYIGFEYDFDHFLRKDDRIDCIVANTGQKIGKSISAQIKKK